MMSALERRDLEIDIIAHLEMEFTTATIGIGDGIEKCEDFHE
jgi:hypothetical protein